MKSRRRIVSPWIETMPKFGFGLHITDHRPSIVLRRGPIGRALTVMRLQRLDRAKQCLFPSSLTSDAVAAVLGFRLPVAAFLLARRRRRRAAEQRNECAPFHCPMPSVLPSTPSYNRRLLRCGISIRLCRVGGQNRSLQRCPLRHKADLATRSPICPLSG
jgi:hypothetical protein